MGTSTTSDDGASVHCDYLAFNCARAGTGGRHGVHPAIALPAIAGVLVRYFHRCNVCSMLLLISDRNDCRDGVIMFACLWYYDFIAF